MYRLESACFSDLYHPKNSKKLVLTRQAKFRPSQAPKTSRFERDSDGLGREPLGRAYLLHPRVGRVYKEVPRAAHIGSGKTVQGVTEGRSERNELAPTGPVQAGRIAESIPNELARHTTLQTRAVRGP